MRELLQVQDPFFRDNISEQPLTKIDGGVQKLYSAFSNIYSCHCYSFNNQRLGLFKKR